MPQTTQTVGTTVAIVFCLVVSGPALAQTTPQGGEPDPANVRVHLGPVLLNPTVELTNLGVDTNVFNDPPQHAPKKDFTLTIVPKTVLWLRLGRSWLTGTIDEKVVWYQTYASERSSNTGYEIGWKVPLARLSFDLDAKHLSTRDRPGFEIDARAERRETIFRGGVELRVLPKTFVAVSGTRDRNDFDNNAMFLNENLHDALNRVSTTGALTVRHQLTPLTSINFDVSRLQDRFEFVPDRNTNSTIATVGVSFDPSALIKGRARFGFRDFVPTLTVVPGYRGAVAAVDLSYTLLGMTRFAVQGIRDVDYSFDQLEPYYVHSGINGSVAQQVVGPVDAVVRLGVQQLDYRQRLDTIAAVMNRTDRVHTYGAGLGYHFDQDLRLGFNIDKESRLSPLPTRQYTGLKTGVSVTYGF